MSAPSSFFGRPVIWVVFALAVLYVPIVGFMVQADMGWAEIHPALNALLNGTSFVFLMVGRFAIRGANEELHKQCMIAAVIAAAVFLISYVTRFAMAGTTHYPGTGIDRIVYLFILFSHMILAMAVVPMVLRSVYLGLKDRRDKHVGLAKWTWPIWIYVSVTGVVVYVMLYPVANALYR